MLLDFRFELGRYSFLRSHELLVLGTEPLVFGLKQIVSHVKAIAFRLKVLGLGRGWVGFGLVGDCGGALHLEHFVAVLAPDTAADVGPADVQRRLAAGTHRLDALDLVTGLIMRSLTFLGSRCVGCDGLAGNEGVMALRTANVLAQFVEIDPEDRRTLGANRDDLTLGVIHGMAPHSNPTDRHRAHDRSVICLRNAPFSILSRQFTRVKQKLKGIFCAENQKSIHTLLRVRMSSSHFRRCSNRAQIAGNFPIQPSSRSRFTTRIGLGLAAVLEGFPLFPGVEDFAGRAALEFADDAVFGHEVDEPGRPAVADAEGALEQRARAASLADHDLDRRLVELVALLERGAAVLAAGPPPTWSCMISRLNSTGYRSRYWQMRLISVSVTYVPWRG